MYHEFSFDFFYSVFIYVDVFFRLKFNRLIRNCFWTDRKPKKSMKATELMLSTILCSLISFDKIHFYGRPGYLIRLFFFRCVCVSIHLFILWHRYTFFPFAVYRKELCGGKNVRTQITFLSKSAEHFAFDVNPNGKSKFMATLDAGVAVVAALFV